MIFSNKNWPGNTDLLFTWWVSTSPNLARLVLGTKGDQVEQGSNGGPLAQKDREWNHGPAVPCQGS